MKILILGGLGFLGVNVSRGFLLEGHSVTVIDRVVPSDDKKLPGCQYIACDFSNLATISSEFQNVDVVIHLISTTLPATSNLNIKNDISANLIGTVQFLQLCVEQNVKRIIFPSSGGTVYGIPESIPIAETHSTNPICSYGIVKLAIEKYLQLFYRLYGLDYRVLRVSNPYGPHQNYRGSQGSVGIFIWKALKGETIEIWGDGSVIRDYLYVGDMVSAFIAAAYSNQDSPKIFNIGSGQGSSLNDVLYEIEHVLQVKPLVKYTSGRGVDVPINILDVSLAETHLGWKVKSPLSDGIIKTIEFIKLIDKQ